MEEEAGDTTIEEADVAELSGMDAEGLMAKFPFLNQGVDDSVASLQGDLEGATTVELARQSGEPIALRVTGTSVDTEESFTHVYPEDTTAFSGGRRRSRLKKQARRTQRKRRNRKGKQLRKLTTRRR
jgi:hypothetical protein